MLKDVLHLFFPELCAACRGALLHHEKIICTSCFVDLPRTNFHQQRGNETEQIFFGRMKVEAAASYYFFNQGSRVQELLHRLKYKNQYEVGELIGEWYGKELLKSPEFSTADFIIPVPLHPKKMKTRGYNQSEHFAIGMSRSMGRPFITNWLVRTGNSETQTKKSKFARWQGVETIFSFQPTEEVNGKHFLLVDDVLTTGATLEACATVMFQKENGIKISLATIAYAQR
jgi:ComF family protein